MTVTPTIYTAVIMDGAGQEPLGRWGQYWTTLHQGFPIRCFATSPAIKGDPKELPQMRWWTVSPSVGSALESAIQWLCTQASVEEAEGKDVGVPRMHLLFVGLSGRPQPGSGADAASTTSAAAAAAAATAAAGSPARGSHVYVTASGDVLDMRVALARCASSLRGPHVNAALGRTISMQIMTVGKAPAMRFSLALPRVEARWAREEVKRIETHATTYILEVFDSVFVSLKWLMPTHDEMIYMCPERSLLLKGAARRSSTMMYLLRAQPPAGDGPPELHQGPRVPLGPWNSSSVMTVGSEGPILLHMLEGKPDKADKRWIVAGPTHVLWHDSAAGPFLQAYVPARASAASQAASAGGSMMSVDGEVAAEGGAAGGGAARKRKRGEDDGGAAGEPQAARPRRGASDVAMGGSGDGGAASEAGPARESAAAAAASAAASAASAAAWAAAERFAAMTHREREELGEPDGGGGGEQRGRGGRALQRSYLVVAPAADAQQQARQPPQHVLRAQAAPGTFGSVWFGLQAAAAAAAPRPPRDFAGRMFGMNA